MRTNYLSPLIGLCLIVVLLGNACTPNRPTPVADSESEQITAPAADIATGSEEQVTITFGTNHVSDIEFYEPLIQQFEQQHPAIQIEWVALSSIFEQANSDTEVLREVATTADIALINASSIYGKQAERYLHDLTPLMDADPSFDTDDFYPGAFIQHPSNSAIYGIQQDIPIRFLLYNQSLWEAQGLPPPTPDWSWDDLFAAAEQLAQQRGSAEDVYGFMGSWGSFSEAIIAVFTQAGLDLTAPADEMVIDQPATAAALERLAQLIESGAVYQHPATDSISSNNLTALISNEQIGLWNADIFINTTLPFEVRAAPFPMPPQAGALFNNEDSWAISAGTQHPEAAWRWLDFLSRQSARSFSTPGLAQATAIPSRQSIAEEIGYWENLASRTQIANIEEVAQFALQQDTTPPFFATIDWEAWQILYDAVDAVLEGDSAESALAEAQTSLDEVVTARLTTPSETAETEPIVVATPPSEPIAEGATEIVFSVPTPFYETINMVATRFHQEQDSVHVTLVPNTHVGGIDTTQTTPSPDCLVGMVQSVETRQFLDLSPLWDGDTTLPRDAFPPALLASLEQNNAVYGLPYFVDVPTLQYNPALFNAANVSYPTADWSLDDFVAAATQLTQDDTSNPQYGFAIVGNHTPILEWWLRREGVTLASDNLQWTDPEQITAIQGYVDLLTSTSPHDQFAGHMFTQPLLALQLVADGQVAMWLKGDSFFGSASTVYNLETIAYAPLPGGTPQNRIDDLSITMGLHIVPQTSHADSCWQWLKYISADVTGISGGVPCTYRYSRCRAFCPRVRSGTERCVRGVSGGTGSDNTA